MQVPQWDEYGNMFENFGTALGHVVKELVHFSVAIAIGLL